ncbi:MAG TPA: hypothetical protein VFZ02_00825 [Ktedonobacteraceae bacterium]
MVFSEEIITTSVASLAHSDGARLAGDRIIEDIYRGVKRNRDGNPGDTQF